MEFSFYTSSSIQPAKPFTFKKLEEMYVKLPLRPKNILFYVNKDFKGDDPIKAELTEAIIYSINYEMAKK